MKANFTETIFKPLTNRNLVREYLQARILALLQQAGAMIPLAFHGGTALRFLYNIGRYSEDLDFALERPNENYNFRAYLQTIQSRFQTEGYQVEIVVKDHKVVHSAFIRFRGLLHELGLSPYPDEVIAVKLEVDTNPPAGAELTTTLIRRHTIVQLQHHNPPSLFAGKLHAILQRNYTKGRDLYDLMWYLSDPRWPAPNLTLLNNALQQTNWEGPPLTDTNWVGVVAQRLETLNWPKVVQDVSPFVENQAELALLTLPTMHQLLKQR